MITSHIHGHLRGTIWVPAVECSMPVSIDLTSERERLHPNRGGSLRYLVVRACADGNFRGANFTADSVLVVKSKIERGNVTIVRKRIIPLSELPSIADCVSEDMPCDGEGE